jgi:hypothetical protein
MCARRALPPAMSVMGGKVWWFDLERICVYPVPKWLWSFGRLRVIMAVYGLGRVRLPAVSPLPGFWFGDELVPL